MGLFETAKSEVDQFESDLVAAIAGTREQQLRALSTIYRLHVELGADPELRKRFAENTGMNEYLQTPGRRPKYPAHAVVRICAMNPERTRDRDFQRKVSVWSGAIAWAERNDVAPDQFETFIGNTENGIEGAYRLEARIETSKSEREAAAFELAEALQRYWSYNQPEPLGQLRALADVPPGKHLLVVEVDDDGDAGVVARLDSDAGWLEAVFDDHVRHWFIQSKAE
jgi:hypothetical protein